MLTAMISFESRTFAIISCITLLVILFLCLYLYTYRLKRKRQRTMAIVNKELIDFSPALTPVNRFVYPLTRVSNPQTSTEFSLNEIPANYKTFDLAKRSRDYLSSDSSYTSSSNRQVHSYAFGTVKSIIQQIHPTSTQNSSDSEDLEPELANPTLEYSLMELFRLQLVYKLYYSFEDNRLIFEIIQLIPMQGLIEQCFTSLICKIRLFLNNHKDKNKKYFSKKNPINELFQFDLDPGNLEKSYLKLHIIGHHQNDKPIELGQTVLVIHQYHHLNNPMEQYTKLIQIYEDRIDMIIRQQVC